MNPWDITKQIIDIETANTDAIIRQRLIELGWTPPKDISESIPKADIMWEDERYPQLILTGDFGTHGYWIDVDTGELERFCVCAAHCVSECSCGAWDEVEND